MDKDFTIIGLEFKKIIINKVFPKEQSIEITLYFNDGVDKEIIRTVDVSVPDNVSEKIVEELVLMEKNFNKKFDGKGLVDSVNVVIKNKEDALEKLKKFVLKVHEGIGKVRSLQSADGYLDMVNNVRRLSVEF